MTKKSKKVVNSVEQIPTSMTEAEARRFWETHQAGEGLLEEPLDADLRKTLKKARATAQSRNITLNLNAGLERRLRRLAELEGTGYQTLIKQFLIERTYQEELRRGILK